MQKFSIKEAIKFGWGKTKSNFWFFVGMLILSWGIPQAFSSLSAMLVIAIDRVQIIKPITLGIVLAIGIIVFLLRALMATGILSIILDIVSGKRPLYKTLFSKYSVLLKYVTGTVIYSLIVMVGLFLFVVPGIIWMIKFQFWPYFVVDKKMGPIQALKESSRITHGQKWQLLRLAFNFIGIAILGAMALLVGLFVAIPLNMVAHAFVYRKLTEPETSYDSQNAYEAQMPIEESRSSGGSNTWVIPVIIILIAYIAFVVYGQFQIISTSIVEMQHDNEISGANNQDLLDNNQDNSQIKDTKDYCPDPYHLLTSGNRCVWSCSTGTVPDIKGGSNECICKDGFVEIGGDKFGRRVCGEEIQ